MNGIGNGGDFACMETPERITKDISIKKIIRLEKKELRAIEKYAKSIFRIYKSTILIEE